MTGSLDFDVINIGGGESEAFAQLCGIQGAELSGITFRGLVETMMESMEVPVGEKSRVSARIRNFLRLGFPAVDSVKGKAVRFNETHRLELAIAMELTNLGFTPDRVIQIIEFNRGLKRADGRDIYMIDTFAIPPIWGNDQPYKVKLKMRRHWEFWG